jgi:NTP pyrophosphatase (non-canonical NTP hydrolase)
MDLNEYQVSALKTDQVPAVANSEKILPLLGLAGEAGQLLSEYKKYLRDGEAHELFPERVAEELGDILWYVASAAAKHDSGKEPS